VEEDYQRCILDDLLYIFPGPYVMLSAYLDESGTHDGSPVMCVAGLLYDREGAVGLDSAWKEALEQAKVCYFHAKEFAHFQGEFRGWEKEPRDQLHRKLVGIVREFARGGAAAFITSEKEFNEHRKAQSWQYGQYTTCAYSCVRMLLNTAGQLDDGLVDFTIESGHKDMRKLDAFLGKLKEAGLSLTHDFRHKKDIRPLQTADLWAYEARKRVHDQLAPAGRKLRGSLKALVEDAPHMRALPLNEKFLQELFEDVRKLFNPG
jgi:hypothetical protein